MNLLDFVSFQRRKHFESGKKQKVVKTIQKSMKNNKNFLLSYTNIWKESWILQLNKNINFNTIK